MSRPPSEATQLRALRRECSELRAVIAQLERELRGHKSALTAMTKDRDEWKERFDVLLRRDPS